MSGLHHPFARILEKAQSILGLSGSGLKVPALDGEIVYSKNNVCVNHPGTNEPVPGYLSLRCSISDQADNSPDSTLILHWIPNITIRLNPKSVDSPRNSVVETVGLSSDFENSLNIQAEEGYFTNSENGHNHSALTIQENTGCSVANGHEYASGNSENGKSISTEDSDTQREYFASTRECQSLASKSNPNRPQTLLLESSILNPDGDDLSVASGSTGGPDSESSYSPTSDMTSLCDTLSLVDTAESIARSHNLSFPGDSSDDRTCTSSTSKPAGPTVFSVNLGAMRSLRLFFSEDSTSCGQLVIASCESQYKIFHFYNGGLDKLAEILEEWNLFHSAKQKTWRKGLLHPLAQQFKVVKPKISEEKDVHPEQCLYQFVENDAWKLFLNEHGQITDEHSLKKAIFFGGLDPAIRKEVWPFLLHYYPYESTYVEREQLRHDKYLEYQKIRKKRIKLSKNEDWYNNFWKTVQNTVEKDVIRTDRGHLYYKGEGNTNVEVLKDILLNYAVAHPSLGYTQGMSDLLSPILAEIKNESDAYWCFVGLMQRTIFISIPKDDDMDRQLLFLKELLRTMYPKFYQHLMSVGDVLGLLFVHRWILLCFKREFCEQDALAIWETCWANVQTDYFHLFIALAIITSYSDDVLQENLPADEMLLHFSNLSHHMNGKLILNKARGLLHQFRKLEKIPCTLKGLCSLCHTGMWDSGHVPAIECAGHKNTVGCPAIGVLTSHILVGDNFVKMSGE